MSTSKPFLLPALAAGVLMLVPATSIGESMLTSRGNASSSLDFRIIIPPVMRVLENSHPVLLDAEASGDWSAQQRLVVMSNLKRGFCVTLRMSAPEVDAWRLRAVQGDGLAVSQVNDGYRLCTERAGHYTLLLDHEFDASSKPGAGPLRWPVQTDIAAL